MPTATRCQQHNSDRFAVAIVLYPLYHHTKLIPVLIRVAEDIAVNNTLRPIGNTA